MSATSDQQLSAGAIARMLAFEDVVRPVLQIISVKSMSSDRHWIRLSDGLKEYNNFLVESPFLSSRIKNKEFEEFAVIVLNDYHIRPIVTVIDINDMSVHTSGQQIGHKLVKSETREEMPRPELKIDINANIQTRTEAPKTTTITLAIDPKEFCPIKSITPLDKSWTVRGRVTSKAAKRGWSTANCRGGSVFSFELSDQSGDIRVNAFGNECEKYHKIIQLNKVYVLSNGTVRETDKRYSNLDHNYEILLNKTSEVKEFVSEDTSDLPKTKYKFTKIKDLETLAIGSVVDVIAIVKQMAPIDEFVDRNGRMTSKLDITLVDQTWTEICLTLWNETAQQFICKPNAVIAVKTVIVKEFDGRSLSSIPNTSLEIEPYIPESVSLRSWRTSGYLQYLSSQSNLRSERPSNRKLLCQINETDGQNKNVFFVRARVAHIHRNLLYKGCDRKHCLKEVLEMSNGKYYCDKCKTESEEFEWRLAMSALLVDCTGQRWVTLYHKEAEKLIEISAEFLNHLEDNNKEEFERVLSLAEYKPFVFKIVAKTETLDTEEKLKLVVHDFKRLDPIKYAKRLLPDIKRLDEMAII